MKYEDIPAGIMANLELGHVLAKHTVTIEGTGVTETHLTTVQLSVAYDEQQRSVHYCNDVCGDFAEHGSVQILMIEGPEPPAAGLDVGKARAWEDSIAMEGADPLAEPTPEELARVEAAAALDDDLNVEEPVVLPPLRVLRAANLRLEVLKAWLYERYRVAIHTGRTELAQQMGMALFVLSTGKRLSDDHEMLGRFLEFLYDSVVVEGAEEMPEWELDCGV